MFVSDEDRARQNWARRVGQVFNTMPRYGYSGNTVWLPRTDLEKKFTAVIENKGVHICLDGPTGTGKTSLALTMLQKLKIKYALVQITKNMEWVEFCQRLVQPDSNAESSFAAEVDFGLDKGLPSAKFRVTLGNKVRPSDDLEYLAAVVKNWTEYDVCRLMVKEHTALLIDDFERANDLLITRVSDMCKLLTQSFHKQYAKLIIVGTDDICKRLYDANPSLEARLEEISLGTLPSQMESWRFLVLGFNALNLFNPATEKFITDAQRRECVQAIYEAADGLPKSLNELGREISMKGQGRNRISPADIMEVTSIMPQKNLTNFRKEFPKIIRCIEGNVAARAVLQHLYSEGIGHIHSWSEILSTLHGHFSEQHLDDAICQLVDVRFLIRTGRSGDVLFVVNPTLAHTLGVLVSNPDKYQLPRALYGKEGQLAFSFRKKEDDQN